MGKRVLESSHSFLGVFKHSFNEDKTPSLSSLRMLHLKLLGLLLTVEGKRSPNGRGLREEKCDKPTTRSRLTRLLDNRNDCENRVDLVESAEKKKGQSGVNSTGSSANSEASGSELCGVLLGVYDCTPSRQCPEVQDEEQSLVSAVLSSLLALSHSAKSAALQGEFPIFIHSSQHVLI